MKVFFLGMAMDEGDENIESFLEMGLKPEEIIRPGGNPVRIFRTMESSVKAIQSLALMSKNTVRALPSGQIAALAKQDIGK